MDPNPANPIPTDWIMMPARERRSLLVPVSGARREKARMRK